MLIYQEEQSLLGNGGVGAGLSKRRQEVSPRVQPLAQQDLEGSRLGGEQSQSSGARTL